MKIFWSIILTLFTLFCGLFLFQNQTRTLSVDTHGYQLSFDLGIWGLAATDLSFAVLIVSTFMIGVLMGCLLPLMIKEFFNRQ